MTLVAAPPEAPRGPSAATGSPSAPSPSSQVRVGYHRTTRWVFTAASLLGSFLLFLVQPMVARFLLPIAGGSASLWNTAMVFFQVTLLIGYVYAHFSTTHLGRRQPFSQIALVLVPLAVLPIAVPGEWELGSQTPVLWVLGILTVMVGLPFFVLSTSSPTLQRWFSLTDHPDAADPYFLYAAGNIGSAAALIGYPLLIERSLTLDQQATLWTAVYVMFALATLASAVLLFRRRAPAFPTPTGETSSPASPSWARRGRWILWAFVPSALMLGVTRHLSADVASFPLLWVLPLFLYLVTFIIVFGPRGDRSPDLARRIVVVGAALVAITMVRQLEQLVFVVGVHLVWFFCAALVSHHRLAADRPEPARLTEFYTLVSVGGALGGIFASLVAPVVFDSVLEYPIAIVLALVVVPGTTTTGGRRGLMVGAAIALGVLGAVLVYDQADTAGPIVMAIGALIAGLLLQRARIVAVVVGLGLAAAIAVPEPDVIHQDRSFFGVTRVIETGDRTTLVSGTTHHGFQLTDEALATVATAYYAPTGPIGQIMDALDDRDDVGIIGLGAGALASYGRPGDTYTFFEIDPIVIEVAGDPELFTFLSDSAARVEILQGDGRRGVEDAPGELDLLVVDAFSSDAIPTHLITREAIEMYFSRLADDGLVAVHISNRFFDLAPVLGRVADDLGIAAAQQLYAPTSPDEYALASRWVVLGPAHAVAAVTAGPWAEVPTDGPLWTDDYSNLLAVLDL